MDILSHGLYGGVAFGRQSRTAYWLAFLFGILPDLVAFGPHFVSSLFGNGGFPRPSEEAPHTLIVPEYVYGIYNLSHSFVIFAVAFALVWLLRRRPLLPMLAWGLHVLIDIPTHTTAFFPTPFLWPLADVRVNGIAWSDPWIFIPNIIILAVLYAGWRYTVRRRAPHAEPLHTTQ